VTVTTDADGCPLRLIVGVAADDPAAVTSEQLTALREALRPVLPIGDRSLEDYRTLLAADAEVSGPDYLL
jgi:hypothetical protein